MSYVNSGVGGMMLRDKVRSHTCYAERGMNATLYRSI